MIKKILSLFFILVLAQNLFADEKEEVKKQLLSKIDGVIKIVQNKSLSKEERNTKIVKLVTPTFDFELMAKLSLGRTWKTLDDDTQEKFVNLYVERMKKSYSEKLDTYTDQKVEITEVVQPKSNRIMISTNLVSDTDKMDVIYKFWKPSEKDIKRDKMYYSSKDKWIVYDVEILGVSILKADRAQFSEFLKTKSVEDLMETMTEIK